MPSSRRSAMTAICRSCTVSPSSGSIETDPDHGPARDGAEMLAARVVGELIGAQGEPERDAQDRFAQGERPAIKIRPERHLNELEVVLLSARRAHGLEERCSTMAQIALIWGASLPR